MFCANLFLSVGRADIRESGLPGNRNNGYGFVVIPMLKSEASGFSYIFASQ